MSRPLIVLAISDTNGTELAQVSSPDPEDQGFMITILRDGVPQPVRIYIDKLGKVV